MSIKPIVPGVQEAVNEAIRLATEAALEYAVSIGKGLDLRALSREIRTELRAVLVPAVQALRAAQQGQDGNVPDKARADFLAVLSAAGVKAAQRSFFELANN